MTALILDFLLWPSLANLEHVRKHFSATVLNKDSRPPYGNVSATSSPGYCRPDIPTTMYCLPLAM